jgi:hypothetical protein
VRASLTVTSRHVGGEDRKAIAHEEREPNPFLVLYDMKKLRSGCKSMSTEDSCQ